VEILAMKVGEEGPAQDAARLGVLHLYIQLVLKKPIPQGCSIALPFVFYRSIYRA
jgi:hypothetical protein